MNKFRLRMFTCLLGAILWGQQGWGQTETLFGISRFGDLYEIDEDKGSSPLGTQVRPRLFSGAYDNFTSLEYLDGYFYAAYDGGKIVKFGLTAGDEIAVGNTSKAIQAMAKGAEGELYIGYGNKVARLNVATLAVTSEVTPDFGPPHNNAYIQGLDWRDGALLVHWTSYIWDNPDTGHFFEIDPQDGEVLSPIGYCPNPCPCWYGEACYALAVRPSDGEIYCASNLFDEECNAPQGNRLNSVTFGEPYPCSSRYPYLGYINLDTFGVCDPPPLADECEYCLDTYPPITGLTYMTLGEGDCDPTDYLLLQNATVSTQNSLGAQGLIRAGYAVNPNATFGNYVVTSGGNLTLNSGTEVRLEPGFSVQGTGLLQVSVNSSYCD